jgi:hypothetical protein
MRYFLCRSFALRYPCTHLWCGHKSSPQLCKTKQEHFAVKTGLLFLRPSGRSCGRQAVVEAVRLGWDHSVVIYSKVGQDRFAVI